MVRRDRCIPRKPTNWTQWRGHRDTRVTRSCSTSTEPVCCLLIRSLCRGVGSPAFPAVLMWHNAYRESSSSLYAVAEGTLCYRVRGNVLSSFMMLGVWRNGPYTCSACGNNFTGSCLDLRTSWEALSNRSVRFGEIRIPIYDFEVEVKAAWSELSGHVGSRTDW